MIEFLESEWWAALSIVATCLLGDLFLPFLCLLTLSSSLLRQILVDLPVRVLCQIWWLLMPLISWPFLKLIIVIKRLSSRSHSLCHTYFWVYFGSICKLNARKVILCWLVFIINSLIRGSIEFVQILVLAQRWVFRPGSRIEVLLFNLLCYWEISGTHERGLGIRNRGPFWSISRRFLRRLGSGIMRLWLLMCGFKSNIIGSSRCLSVTDNWMLFGGVFCALMLTAHFFNDLARRNLIFFKGPILRASCIHWGLVQRHIGISIPHVPARHCWGTLFGQRLRKLVLINVSSCCSCHCVPWRRGDNSWWALARRYNSSASHISGNIICLNRRYSRFSARLSLSPRYE
jgi:hypothetical protein